MNLNISGKLALVTGSTKGIGRAIAAGLAGEGARVIVNGRSHESVQKTIGELRAANPDGVFEAFAGDLADASVADALVQQYPNVEILINNLGIFEPKAFQDIPDEDWRRFFEVNVLSGVRLSRLYLPAMKRRNWGRIVFISSESGVQIPAEMIHYGMTKAAQIAVARGIAETCAGTGVTVNSVLPGPTRSDGVETFMKQMGGGKPFAEFEIEFFEKIRPSSLLKRFATTDEVANLVIYLSSPLASATNGAAMRVDGGVVRSAF